MEIFLKKKTYTIGQVSEMTGLPVSTLRYYDKEGLFPALERISGIRRFSEREVDALSVIECLKSSGLEIKDIKVFMEWCAQGPKTYSQRLEMFRRQRAVIEEDIDRLNRILAKLTFKCWYYEQALADGSEDRVRAIKPEDMPEAIKEAYENSFSLR
ncbi:MAG: MerR family transcriptional regulator [Eggerthellaceae bacterium]